MNGRVRYGGRVAAVAADVLCLRGPWYTWPLRAGSRDQLVHTANVHNGDGFGTEMLVGGCEFRNVVAAHAGNACIVLRHRRLSPLERMAVVEAWLDDLRRGLRYDWGGLLAYALKECRLAAYPKRAVCVQHTHDGFARAGFPVLRRNPQWATVRELINANVFEIVYEGRL